MHSYPAYHRQTGIIPFLPTRGHMFVVLIKSSKLRLAQFPPHTYCVHPSITSIDSTTLPAGTGQRAPWWVVVPVDCDPENYPKWQSYATSG